ncbi:MAG: hypothetical protein OHK0046_24880 [Anaerolineae bacterium]
MGSGNWSPNTYQVRATQRQAKGQDVFAYSQGASSVHPSLSPYGLEVRESRDNADHPASNSIIVGLDVTGSMGKTVRTIHKDLPQLLGLLLDHKYVPSPQIMFAAFSNGSCDPVAVQVGQFESDNRMDMNLENMILGGQLAGGCDARESAELLVYLAARHTSIDCYEKRQRKGYLFLITDEMAYDHVKADEIKRIFNANIGANIPLQQMVAEAQERYHIFVLIPMETQSGRDPNVFRFYQSYFDNEHVIRLENSDDVSETIALAIGLTEGNITLKEGLQHLEKRGSSRQTLNTLAQALSLLDKKGVRGGGGLSDDDNDKKRRTRRLF